MAAGSASVGWAPLLGKVTAAQAPAPAAASPRGAPPMSRPFCSELPGLPVTAGGPRGPRRFRGIRGGRPGVLRWPGAGGFSGQVVFSPRGTSRPRASGVLAPTPEPTAGSGGYVRFPGSSTQTDPASSRTKLRLPASPSKAPNGQAPRAGPARPAGRPGAVPSGRSGRASGSGGSAAARRATSPCRQHRPGHDRHERDQLGRCRARGEKPRTSPHHGETTYHQAGEVLAEPTRRVPPPAGDDPARGVPQVSPQPARQRAGPPKTAT